MNIRQSAWLPRLLFRPVIKTVLKEHFRPGDQVKGKIIQALPRQNFFVLHSRGMNLVAKTNLSLFVGDRIVGEVLENDERIELKLLEVNGKPTHHQMQFQSSDIQFARIALNPEIWGQDTWIEIFQDADRRRSGQKESSLVEGCRILFSSKELRNIAIEMRLRERILMGTAWVEMPELLDFLQSRENEIASALIGQDIQEVSISFLPMIASPGEFRTVWGNESGLDVRA